MIAARRRAKRKRRTNAIATKGKAPLKHHCLSVRLVMHFTVEFLGCYGRWFHAVAAFILMHSLSLVVAYSGMQFKIQIRLHMPKSAVFVWYDPNWPTLKDIQQDESMVFRHIWKILSQVIQDFFTQMSWIPELATLSCISSLTTIWESLQKQCIQR